MTEELSTELTSVIHGTHHAACVAANDSRTRAEDALALAVQCGGYIEQVRGMTKGRMLGWLRDHVPDLTPDRAKAYLSLFHTQAKRECKDLDKQQLLLLGVLDKRVDERDERVVSRSGQWFMHVNKVRGWFSKSLRDRPIEKWEADEIESAVNQLKPMVEIYQQLVRAKSVVDV
jgi:hypothetical protein